MLPLVLKLWFAIFSKHKERQSLLDFFFCLITPRVNRAHRYFDNRLKGKETKVEVTCVGNWKIIFIKLLLFSKRIYLSFKHFPKPLKELNAMYNKVYLDLYNIPSTFRLRMSWYVWYLYYVSSNLCNMYNNFNYVICIRGYITVRNSLQCSNISDS